MVLQTFIYTNVFTDYKWFNFMVTILELDTYTTDFLSSNDSRVARQHKNKEHDFCHIALVQITNMF